MSHKVSDFIKKEGAQRRGRKYYENNREITLKRAKDWYNKNKDKVKVHRTKPLHVWKRYSAMSFKDNRTFLLTLEQVEKFINDICSYCGSYPNPINGIDRVDNSVGYESDNCVSCCPSCNRMKHVLLVEDFLKKCTEISEYQKRTKQ